MKTSDFDYHLPEHLIAQKPAANREESRLLVLSTSKNTISHHRFSDLSQFLRSGDVLVLNDTKVLKARLKGTRKTGGAVEILLLSEQSPSNWIGMIKPARKIRTGEELIIQPTGDIITVVKKYITPTQHLLKIATTKSIGQLLEECGQLPLPPYIDTSDAELKTLESRYQTVFASAPGAIAAATAGLHFSQPLLAEPAAKGIQIEKITLHVGYGTFKSIETEHIEDHHMHAEHYEISSKTAMALNKARQKGQRIFAVGTTALRTLESAWDDGSVNSGPGQTKLYVTPGYHFKVISGLITNFHLPQTSLLVLVASLAGRENILHAYREAIQHDYRFYSFGDAMLILP